LSPFRPTAVKPGREDRFAAGMPTFLKRKEFYAR
jgi:hypothetical protein